MVLHFQTAGVLFRDPLGRIFRVLIWDRSGQDYLFPVLHVNRDAGAGKSRVFLDGGLEAAAKFVERALGDDLRRANPIAAAAADPKTMLQEKLQATRQPVPRYTVVETLGPPHKRIFHVELKWDGGSTRGEGPTIKAAEAAAARAALQLMENEQSENSLA